MLFGLTAVTGGPGIGGSKRGGGILNCGIGVTSRAMSEDDLLGGVGGSESVSGVLS